MEIERRITLSDATVEYREVENGEKKPVISGYAAVFNSESRVLNGFVEKIHPSAFDEVLSTNPDVIGVFNHDRNLLLGRTSNGTMRLSKDAYGLRYEITPNEKTSIGHDVVEWVKDRTVVGSSFAFAVKKDGTGDRWDRDERGMHRREVRNVALLEDVGPVVRPAYASASVVVSRRAIEMALGENYRPPQTMANASKRGLKLAERNEGVDQNLVVIADRIAERQVVSVEECEYLSAAYRRCLESKARGWHGTSAWVEWQLAGGDTGQKWVQRRTAQEKTESREAGDVDLKPTAGMAAAAKRGLRLHEAGRSGDGLKPETVARANKLARREEMNRDWVVEMNAWFKRHAADKRPGWDMPGRESPGFTAYLLWGGAAGASFSARKVAELERVSKRAMGDKSQSTPAPKKDQIKGSDKNEPGSAKNASSKIAVNDSIREALKNKASNHNDEMKKAGKPTWARASVGQLLAVYRRGAGAFSTSHRPGVTRGQWAMARVNAYLYLLKNGSPKDSKYVSDNDLLPSSHPKASEKRHLGEMEEAMDDDDAVEGLSPANVELYEAYEEIAAENGQWPQEGPGGAHYIAQSPFVSRGIKCQNCVFYEEEGMCHIVSGEVAANGVCKLWVIPEDRMSEEKNEEKSAVVEAAPTEEQVASAQAAAAARDESMDAIAKAAALKAILLSTRLHGASSAS